MRDPSPACCTPVLLLRLDAHLLRTADHALGGKLGDALVGIVHAGGEPELLGVRCVRPDGPSTWTLVVRGGGVQRVFAVDATDRVVLALAVHLYVTDLVAEVRRDVARVVATVEQEEAVESALRWTGAGTGRAREPS